MDIQLHSTLCFHLKKYHVSKLKQQRIEYVPFRQAHVKEYIDNRQND